MKTPLHCHICGRTSGDEFTCENCNYLLSKGSDEENIRAMLSNDKAIAVWKENAKRAQDLAGEYYEIVLEDFESVADKKDTETFGYNTFLAGINMALDIMMPLLDKNSQERVEDKIKEMLMARKIHEKRAKNESE